MAYRFKLQEPLAQEARRVALEQIDMAEEKLASKDDVAGAIHDARRCLKRLRALIRLVRPALGDGAYRRETERVAGAGRLLAGARDVHVMRLTASKLESRFGPLPDGAGKRLQAMLTASAAAIPSDTVKDGRAQALKRLKQTRKFFAGHALDGVSVEALAEGLERCYRKGRRAFREAFRKPSDESFHAWRKSVQRHWRHMQLISRAWPEALSARASEAKDCRGCSARIMTCRSLRPCGAGCAGSLTREDKRPSTGFAGPVRPRSGRVEPRGTRLFAEPPRRGGGSRPTGRRPAALPNASPRRPPPTRKPATESRMRCRKAATG